MSEIASPPFGSRRPRWYRSLYWRIVIALIALVAVMLAAEGALFLWLSDRTAGAMPGRSPEQMVRLVASDLSVALGNNPKLDVQQYIDQQYGHFFRTILVVMRDGRVIANHNDVTAEEVRLAAQLRDIAQRGLRRRPGDGDGRPFDGDGRPGDGDPDGRPGDSRGDRDGPRGFNPFEVRRRPPGFRGELASIEVDGTRRGLVAIMPGDPPFSRIVRVVGPTMALVAGGVLIAGGSLIALLVFGPARRRLLQLQDATERLGSGDLLARAPEHGGDEIEAVARSFNHMAAELTRRARALEASDRARRQLLADVSHELMTPLTAMRGYIETLGMPELQLDGPTRERYMRIVTEETHRLEHIIGDLLDLARLEGGGTTMRRERVSLENVFERVAERHERELNARRIRLVREIAPEAEQVIGDPDRLEQVFQNLVANALRYTPDEGRIELRATRTADATHVVVRDSGPGIPPDHLPLIFDRFYKADPARKQAGGSGLGLSIAKAIVERHGGTITARNDGGAVFEIILP